MEGETPAPQSNSQPSPQPVSAPEQSKTNAVLAWLFAPFTSYAWKDSPNEFLRSHARESLYFGIANLAVFGIYFVLQIFYSILIGPAILGSIVFGFGVILGCVWSVLYLALLAFTIVPRIVGIVKANNREKWEVPYVTEFVRRYVKL